MNDQAQNALLKSLEEPAPRSHVILVSSAVAGLRPTIRSRCQRLRFGPLPRAVIAESLVAARGLGTEQARLQAALAGGSLGTALTREPGGELALREQVLALLEGAAGRDPLARMEAAEQLEQAEDPVELLGILRSLLRDLGALRAGASASALLNPDLAERLAPLAAGPLGERALGIAEQAEGARAALRGFASKLMTFDRLLDALAGD
jgi:DNA polymerase-3 subunit delta'